MEKIIDLDRVMITVSAAVRWNQLAITAVRTMRQHKKLTAKQAAEMPDEQGRLNEDGSLMLFVQLPNGSELSLRLPPNEWEWRQ